MNMRLIFRDVRIYALALVTMSGLAGCQFVPKGPTRAERAATLTAQAQAAEKAGDLAQAMELFQQALALDSANTDAHLGIGDLHQVTGNYDEAANQYEQARQTNPSSYTANFKLGLMYHMLNRLRDAIRSYLAALTINPSSVEANLDLATAYLQLDQPQLAKPYAEQAVTLSPDNASARINLGAIYSSLGDEEKALAEYRAASDVSKKFDAHVAMNLANAELKVGSPAKAVALLNQLVEREPSAHHYERLGYACFKTGEMDQSLAAYEQAIQIDANDTAALNGLGVNLMTRYIQGGRSDRNLRNQAIEAWQKSIRINRDQSRILDLISRYARL